MMATRPAAVIATSQAILHRIRSEYFEMPDLCLTLSQAQRLWGLSREECERLLEQLVGYRFLRRTRNGAFVRMD